MRITGGFLGGRRLEVPSAIRPTQDMVRQAVFSALAARVSEARVLDLFAGSGALAIEALSRGAATATLVERDARAAATIRANLEGLGLAEPRATLVVRPASAALGTALARGDAYDLVFLDPPYRQAPDLGADLTTSLEPLLAPGARVVTESDRRAPLDLALPVVHERRYGDTLIRIHTP